MLYYAMLIAGFALLIKSADWLVEGASSLAVRLKVKPIIIGLTVVAFGTSMPELVVNLFAVFQGKTDIAIGNVVGSNIANIFLILGTAAAIYPLAVQKNTTYKEIPFALLAALMLYIMASDRLTAGAQDSALARSDGLALLGFFAVFLYYVLSIGKDEDSDPSLKTKMASLPKSAAWITAGLAGLALGGKWIVDGATAVAVSWGASQALIGLTVVAIGTSLPELATSVIAALKKQSDIAVGNVVGSNIFNTFWILGISSAIKPLPVSQALGFDMAANLAATLFLFIFMFLGKRHTLQRWQGAAFIVLYLAYSSYLVARG